MIIFKTDPYHHSIPIFALLNDAKPTRVQTMMRHQQHVTSKIYAEEIQRLAEEAKDAVTQIKSAGSVGAS